MSRWVIFKYRFQYQHHCTYDDIDELCSHKECTLHFAASINEELADQNKIMAAAIKSIKTVGRIIDGDSSALPLYDFGSLTSNDILDDIKKLFLVNLPDGKKQVQLRLSKDKVFALYDDGSDINK